MGLHHVGNLLEKVSANFMHKYVELKKLVWPLFFHVATHNKPPEMKSMTVFSVEAMHVWSKARICISGGTSFRMHFQADFYRLTYIDS